MLTGTFVVRRARIAGSLETPRQDTLGEYVWIVVFLVCLVGFVP